MSLDRGSIRDRRHQQNDDMKRLLLLLAPLVLADPAIAFDGGWHDKEEKPELSTDQSETLGNVFRVSPILHGHPNDHVVRGCRINGRSGYSTLLLRYTPSLRTWKVLLGQSRNTADIECANQGTISKKEAFIWWALPLHRQHLEDEPRNSHKFLQLNR